MDITLMLFLKYSLIPLGLMMIWLTFPNLDSLKSKKKKED